MFVRHCGRAHKKNDTGRMISDLLTLQHLFLGNRIHIATQVCAVSQTGQLAEDRK